MTKLDRLLARYEEFIALPWAKGLAGAQRTIFVCYDPADERRLRARIEEFELATTKARHGWKRIDLTDAFAEWMGALEYRESYFEYPEDLAPALTDFEEHLQREIRERLYGVGEEDVVALTGVGSLFGFTSVSALIAGLADAVPGRLLVLFPGEYENNTYRLFDARDGWGYLAIPITAHQEA